MTTPHVPSKASVERCAEALWAIQEGWQRPVGEPPVTLDAASDSLLKYLSAQAKAVLQCAVERCGYADPQMCAEFVVIANNTSDALGKAIRVWKERAERAEAESLEQARLLGMGGQREAALMAKLADMTKDRDAWQETAVRATLLANTIHGKAEEHRAALEGIANESPQDTEDRGRCAWFDREMEKEKRSGIVTDPITGVTHKEIP